MFWDLGLGFRVSDFVLLVESSGFRVWVWALRFAKDLGFRLGFQVVGSEL